MKINKWLLLGYIAAIFNPLPTGLVAGAVLYTEKNYRKHGLIVLVLSVFLIALTIVTVSYFPNGIFNGSVV